MVDGQGGSVDDGGGMDGVDDGGGVDGVDGNGSSHHVRGRYFVYVGVRGGDRHSFDDGVSDGDGGGVDQGSSMDGVHHGGDHSSRDCAQASGQNNLWIKVTISSRGIKLSNQFIGGQIITIEMIIPLKNYI